ncbi:TPA: hypothetical protein ACVU5S_003280 [Vibrio parahaemolyticus]|uniref:hypothetical protein n=1 Tax=Vibrio TaxID=662 RepID=UPI0005B43F3F|nr:hypothetical protein [Vibrio parahaemolyticus]ATI47249.1 hypothetical protein CO725_17145 [Vibrio parahaemolyticus]EJB8585011.1 hypothetical protein [Vibrio parahaemolyticus]ELA9389106.1 hypothetical protein [Vibrio parahaemolyticus]MDF4987657.1 hypothetical protein [Vibrio parahaemolyticus]MDF5006571.1 hypothetical protein [Vibrio parahaemolyticus]
MSKSNKPVANSAATQAIFKLLEYAVNTPQLFVNDEHFKTALQSQSGIAELVGEWNINGNIISKKKISLNTLKKYAALEFNRGFEEINDLRLKACDSIDHELSKDDKPNKRTKKGLTLLVAELEDALEKHKEINFILLQALSAAMAALQSISETKDSKLRNQRTEDCLEKLRAIVSLNMPPFNELEDKNKVISLAEYKDEKK